MDRELLQDSDGVNESFWGSQGVEIEAEQVFDARVRVGTHGGAPITRKAPPMGSRVPRLGDPAFRGPGD